MKGMTSVLFVALSTVFATVANASPMLYLDRATFESAITIDQTVDFESAFPFAQNSIAFGDLTFNSTDGTGIHRTASGSFGGTSTRLAAQNSGGIRIDVAGSFNALGMEVGELFRGLSTGTFTLFDTSSNVIASHVMDVGYFGPSPSYIGWISDVAIGGFLFTVTGSNDFETIDNVVLGNGSTGGAVPEPASLALLGLGLLVGARRRHAAGA
ncbi:MAG: PEP-CTERM sorting domain-containing protein [Gammaproteobacteria bacterium]|nr:PEP-CTERM sorting domain-containing protein [Gammaproteobacteria bacterium]